MTSPNQEALNSVAVLTAKKYSEVMRVAKKCDADVPRYIALILALKTLFDWIDIDSIDPNDSRRRIWISQNKSKWVDISFEGSLKDRGYGQMFRDENLCMLLADTMKMNVEVKHGGVLYKGAFSYQPAEAMVQHSDLLAHEKNASSVTIAYLIVSDRRKLGMERTSAVYKYLANKSRYHLMSCFSR